MQKHLELWRYVGFEPTLPYDKNGIFKLYDVLPFTPNISLLLFN